MTSDVVLRFAEYMFGKWDLEIVKKENSWLMNFIGWFLQLIRVMKKKTFMERYTTTMFGKVYLNFELGNLEQRSWASQMALIAHESEHRRQCTLGPSWWWRLEYLFSKKKRALYEMWAYGTSIKIIYNLTGYIVDSYNYAQKLEDYGLIKYVKSAEKYYEHVIANLNNDTYDSQVDIDAKQWIKDEMLSYA